MRLKGAWDYLIGKVDPHDPAQRVLPEPYEPFISTGGIPVMDPGTPLEWWNGKSQVDKLWRTQPAVRKVVDFAARSLASIPLHAFDRVGDTDRKRITGTPLANLLKEPRPELGAFRFWHSVFSDHLLYDRWAALASEDELVRIPAWRFTIAVDSLNRPLHLNYWPAQTTAGDKPIRVPLAEVIFDYGYSPAGIGTPLLDTLQGVLEATTEGANYKRQLWKNGARIPSYVYRPADAVPWTSAQRNRFFEGLRNFTRGGGNEGGMPLIPDGMEIRELKAFSAVDSEELETRKLTAVEVASAWHIPPELVGAREANYSNMKELRKALFRDSLGPSIAAWEDVLNLQLLPRLEVGGTVYVEANVESKLRGSFEEQAQIYQAAVGAPYMTPNEARGRQNLPALPGGDELVRPLNVTTGGQANPQDSGEQNEVIDPVKPEQQPKARVPLMKLRDPKDEERAHAVLVDFFRRQARTVTNARRAGVDWWNADRWNTELGDDLLGLSEEAATKAAKGALKAAGLDPDAYDVDRTLNWLREASRRNAEAINQATFDALDELDADDPGTDVFTAAEESRALETAMTLTAFAAGFGMVESGRQRGKGATKTWNVTSRNPRSSHAAMDGETVAVEDDFSNGMPWPGAAGNPDEVAGCQCTLTMNYPEA